MRAFFGEERRLTGSTKPVILSHLAAGENNAVAGHRRVRIPR